MHIKPIVSAMLRNKTGTLLVIAEIALTLAFMSNAIYIVAKSVERINMDTGLDLDHLVAVHPQGYTNDFDARQVLIEDLDTMRNIQDIVGVSPVMSSIPGTGYGWTSTLYNKPEEDADFINVMLFESDESIIHTLGLKLTIGRNFNYDDVRFTESRNLSESTNILISEALANKFFPEGNVLGNPLWTGVSAEGGEAVPHVIVGVYERMTGRMGDITAAEMTAIIPRIVYRPGYDPNYIFRAKLGMTNQAVAQAEEDLSKTPGRVVTLRPVKQSRLNGMAEDKALSIIMISVTILLVLVTALGIAGLAAFSVNKRRKQIGTRRALGARKVDILNYFLVENWLMTTTGIVIGVVLALVMNLAVANLLNAAPIKLSYIFYSVIGLWVLGLCAVWGPAKRASEIEPAIATRNV